MVNKQLKMCGSSLAAELILSAPLCVNLTTPRGVLRGGGGLTSETDPPPTILRAVAAVLLTLTITLLFQSAPNNSFREHCHYDRFL